MSSEAKMKFLVTGSVGLAGEAKPDECERKVIAEFEKKKIRKVRTHTLVVLAFKIFLEKKTKRLQK